MRKVSLLALIVIWYAILGSCSFQYSKDIKNTRIENADSLNRDNIKSFNLGIYAAFGFGGDEVPKLYNDSMLVFFHNRVKTNNGYTSYISQLFLYNLNSGKTNEFEDNPLHNHRNNEAIEYAAIANNSKQLNWFHFLKSGEFSRGGWFGSQNEKFNVFSLSLKPLLLVERVYDSFMGRESGYKYSYNVVIPKNISDALKLPPKNSVEELFKNKMFFDGVTDYLVNNPSNFDSTIILLGDKKNAMLGELLSKSSNEDLLEKIVTYIDRNLSGNIKDEVIEKLLSNDALIDKIKENPALLKICANEKVFLSIFIQAAHFRGDNNWLNTMFIEKFQKAYKEIMHVERYKTILTPENSKYSALFMQAFKNTELEMFCNNQYGEESKFKTAKESENIEQLQNFIAKFPNGKFALQAKQEIERINIIAKENQERENIVILDSLIEAGNYDKAMEYAKTIGDYVTIAYKSESHKVECLKKAVTLIKSIRDCISIAANISANNSVLEQEFYTYATTFDDFMEYQIYYPKGKFIGQVKQRINNFVKDNPSDSQVQSYVYKSVNKKDIKAISAFCEKYNNYEIAKDDLNKYVSENAQQTFADMFAANGDGKNFVEWAERGNSMFQKGEKFNIFVGGSYKNTGKIPLKIKINNTLHLIENTTKRTLLSSYVESKNEDLTAAFFLDLAPGEEAPFLNLYKITSGSGFNAGLLGGSSSNYDFATPPYTITCEYWPNQISSETQTAQQTIIDQVAKNGNVDTKKGFGQKLNSAFGLNGDFADLFVYCKTKDEPYIYLYDTDGNQIKELQSKRNTVLNQVESSFTNLDDKKDYVVKVGDKEYKVFVKDLTYFYIENGKGRAEYKKH